MITLTREEAQQVLKVLEYPGPSWPESRTELAVALRYKLAEPEPEPVAWRKQWEGETKWEYYEFDRYQGSEPLYTAPPQREWRGLTDEEVQSEVARVLATLTQDIWPIALSRAIEAKVREKNT
jgi:hypothetical protein